MPAPTGNTNAAKGGFGRLIRIHVPTAADFDLIVESLTTEERGKILLEATEAEWDKALTIVDDCAKCGEPINATEARIYWNGQRICESCEVISLAAQE